MLFPESEEKTVQEHILRGVGLEGLVVPSKKQTNLKSDQKEDQKACGHGNAGPTDQKALNHMKIKLSSTK